MKFRQLVMVACMAFGIFAVSCSPENVQPKGEPEVGALVTDTTVHKTPDPKCNVSYAANLIGNLQNNWIALGKIEVVNGEDYLHAVMNLDAPLAVHKVALWRGDISSDCDKAGSECTMPVGADGSIDPSQFMVYKELSDGYDPYAITVELEKLYERNQFAVWALAQVVDGETVIFSAEVWADGNSIQGGRTFDYVLANDQCEWLDCEKWIDGNPPCSQAACQIPSAGPGDDLSDYECGNGKVTVCHLPPGNPENMQEICISTRALPAHVIDFKPENNACLGHHSGCHLGPCDPCGEGSSADNAPEESPCPGK